MSLTRWLALAIGGGLLTLSTFILLRGQRPPPLLVADEAELMTVEQREFLSRFHSFLVDDHDIDYRVVTATGTDDINRYAVERFAELFADSRSVSGRGLLLVVDPEQDVVRLEVATALEGVFPDAFVAYVENLQMVPFFRSGRIADGILASTELVVTRAQRAASNAGFEAEAWATESAGGGAVTEARIGAGTTPGNDAPRRAPPPPKANADATPQRVIEAYLDAMSARNGDPDLPIYTPETRAMLRGWTTTPAQMDSIVKTYRSCHPEAPAIGPQGRLAVVRYPISERACAPFFLQRADGGWRLDLTMMQLAIRFGRTNAWRFDPTVSHPYAFAFHDWRFDGNGFPQGTRAP